MKGRQKNWRQKIFRKKVAHCRKKSKGRTLLVPADFVCYLEKVVKKERGKPLD